MAAVTAVCGGSMFYAIALAWAALVTADVAAAPASPAPAAKGPDRELIFRCQVSDEMSVTHCNPREDAQLAPGEASAMIAAIEQSRCATKFDAGINVERGIELPKPGEPASTYHVVSFPDWVSGIDRALEFYPAQAAKKHQTGKVTLACDVLVNGALDNCTVFDEAPLGQGFGEAALKASTYFRFLPKTVDCQPVEGGKVHIPVYFRFH